MPTAPRRSFASRAARAFGRHQWLILGALAVAGVVCGYLGYRQFYAERGEPTHPFDLGYQVVQLVWFNSYTEPSGVPWLLRLARVIVPLVVLFAAVKGLLALFYWRVQKIKAGRSRRHTIVCGLGRKGMFIARRLRELGEPVVIIERDPLHRDLAAAQDTGAVVITGDATQSSVLRTVGIHRARRLVAASGDDDTNAAIAAAARELAVDEGGALHCLVHIGDPDLFHALGEQRFQASQAGRYWLELFSVPDSATRAALNAYPPFDVDATDSPAPHMIVCGAGALAQCLIAQAAKRWETSNATGRGQLVVTIIDERARGAIEHLSALWPGLTDVCDLRPVEAARAATASAAATAAEGPEPLAAVYVCEADSHEGWPEALMVEQALRERRIPVVLLVNEKRGIASLAAAEERDSACLHIVSVLEAACEPDVLFGGLQNDIARAIHEDYRRRELDKSREQRRDDARSLRGWGSWTTTCASRISLRPQTSSASSTTSAVISSDRARRAPHRSSSVTARSSVLRRWSTSAGASSRRRKGGDGVPNWTTPLCSIRT